MHSILKQQLGTNSILLLFKGLNDESLLKIREYSGVAINVTITQKSENIVSTSLRMFHNPNVKWVINNLKKYEGLIYTSSILGVNLWMVLSLLSKKEIKLIIEDDAVLQYYKTKVEPIYKILKRNLIIPDDFNYYEYSLHDLIDASYLVLDNKLLVIAPDSPVFTNYGIISLTSKSTNNIGMYELSSLFLKKGENCTEIKQGRYSNCLVVLKNKSFIVIAKYESQKITQLTYAFKLGGKWHTVINGRIFKGFFPQFSIECTIYGIHYNDKVLLKMNDTVKNHLHVLKKCYGTEFFWRLTEHPFSKRININAEIVISFIVDRNCTDLSRLRLHYKPKLW